MGKNAVTGILLIVVAVLMIGIILFADKLNISGISLSQVTGGTKAPGKPPSQEDYAPDEIVMRFQPGASKADQDKLLQTYSLNEIKEIPEIKIKVLKVNPKALDAVIEALSHNPNVEFAEKNYVVRATYTPNDPGFSQQWGLNTIKARQAWDITKGSSSIKIAILDTGIDMDHPDLASKIVSSIDFTGSPNSYNDIFGHGTHCAGIAAAATNNGIGVAGVCPDCSLMNVKILDDSGFGYSTWVADGIRWATDNGANVISMSFARQSITNAQLIAVNYAWNRGVVLVAGVNDTPTTNPVYPAYFPYCIAVAASNQSDKLASFSGYGDWVDVAAPGQVIYSTVPVGGCSLCRDTISGYKSLNGTSFATPHVSGLAGLLFTKVTDTNGNGLLNDEVRYRIESTADLKEQLPIGGGRINAYEALRKPYFYLSASPSSILPDGSFISTINATTSDKASGKIISFLATLGTLSPSNCTTDRSGSCSVTIRYSGIATSVVFAAASGYVPNAVTFTFGLGGGGGGGGRPNLPIPY